MVTPVQGGSGVRKPWSSAAPWVAYGGGPVAAIVVWLLAPPEMPPAARKVAALAAWMAAWWLTAVLPLAVTALLPVAVLPIAGVASFEAVARHYADPIVFLFLGGFFLAAATQRWGVHRRLAVAVIAAVGASGARLVLALMIATAFMSMWISNTATAALMLPIAIALVDLARRGTGQTQDFAPAVVLGMAYAASIGGVATLIGTPPTAIFAAAARTAIGRPIGFGEWLVLGLPVSLVLLAVCWLVLVRGVFRVRGALEGVAELVAAERRQLGPWTSGQRLTVGVLVAAGLAWVLREPKTVGGVTIPGLADAVPGLTDAGIAAIAALVLFVAPTSRVAGRFALDWQSASRIAWDVLLLFGGGLALAAAFEGSGLALWLAQRLGGLAGLPSVAAIGVVTLFFVLLTELTSNTATAAMAMPIVASLAPALGVEPLPLMAAAALGSAMGFMLPVGTPPNALAFGSGAVTAAQMRRAGLWIDLAGAVVITVAVMLWT